MYKCSPVQTSTHNLQFASGNMTTTPPTSDVPTMNSLYKFHTENTQNTKLRFWGSTYIYT